MPNLKQLVNIKTEYGDANSYLKRSEVKALMEAFDPNRIVKAFSLTDPKELKYIEYFKNRKKVDAVLLFIDVTSFSSRFQSKTADEIASFLDAYYDKIIPIIGKHGGEIEKIIGDGIICVFGEPFLTLSKMELHRAAEKCAVQIVADLKGTIYESKVAFHYGEIMYYQNKSDEYYEFTMIGNALTELFRLESVSHSNSVNFFTETYYEELNIQDVTKTNLKGRSVSTEWILSDPESVLLKGVTHTSIRRLKKV
jgi:class 3 adenylate cyclase